VIELGHALGLSVTAEGVETSDQLGNLQTTGCDTFQGFLFSRPQHPDDIGKILVDTAAAIAVAEAADAAAAVVDAVSIIDAGAGVVAKT